MAKDGHWTAYLSSIFAILLNIFFLEPKFNIQGLEKKTISPLAWALKLIWHLPLCVRPFV